MGLLKKVLGVILIVVGDFFALGLTIFFVIRIVHGPMDNVTAWFVLLIIITVIGALVFASAFYGDCLIRNAKSSEILWDRKRFAPTLDNLRRLTRDDFLKLSTADIIAAATANRINQSELDRLRELLYREAVECEFQRLQKAYFAGQKSMTPAPRQVATWGKAIGFSDVSIREVASKASGPINFIRGFLRDGKIDSEKRMILDNIAAACGADASDVSAWIDEAVDAAIAELCEEARQRNSLRRHLSHLLHWPPFSFSNAGSASAKRTP